MRFTTLFAHLMYLLSLSLTHTRVKLHNKVTSFSSLCARDIIQFNYRRNVKKFNSLKRVNSLDLFHSFRFIPLLSPLNKVASPLEQRRKHA